MAVIDVHTHMLTRGFLDGFVAWSKGAYSMADDGDGNLALLKGDAPVLTPTKEMFDYDLRAADMDRLGIDVSIVSLTAPNTFWGGETTSIDTAVTMNDWMAAARERYPSKMRHFASLPWQYPDAAVRELHRAVDNGAVGVITLANIDEVSLTNPHFVPVWDAIDALGLPVLIHPTSLPALDRLDLDRHHLVWSTGFPVDTTIALSRMLLDGFFDRYQSLKIIGGHGAGGFPLLVARLDHGYDVYPSVRKNIAKRPVDYLGQIYADSVIYTESALKYTVEVLGEQNVLFGTDYPHTVSFPEKMLGLNATLPEGTRQLVAGGNAERIFQLEL